LIDKEPQLQVLFSQKIFHNLVETEGTPKFQKAHYECNGRYSLTRRGLNCGYTEASPLALARPLEKFSGQPLFQDQHSGMWVRLDQIVIVTSRRAPAYGNLVHALWITGMTATSDRPCGFNGVHVATKAIVEKISPKRVRQALLSLFWAKAKAPKLCLEKATIISTG